MAGEWRRSDRVKHASRRRCARQRPRSGTKPHVSRLRAAAYPVIRGQNDGRPMDHGRLTRSSLRTKASRRCKRALHPGDVVFTAARNARASERCPDGCTSRVTRVAELDAARRCNRELARPRCSSYYFLQLSSCRTTFAQSASQAVPTANTSSDLRADSLALPPLPEQRAIAHILGTLDDKIELNRRMNETLEAMARALFKSWFVDFDPVRAKAEGRDPGLPQPLADLFPDRFEDSELGEIPAGWEVETLSEFR